MLVLMAAILLALGLPLAASVAAAEQQRLIVDRIDDTELMRPFDGECIDAAKADAEEDRVVT